MYEMAMRPCMSIHGAAGKADLRTSCIALRSVLVPSTVQQGGGASREKDRSSGECTPPGVWRTGEEGVRKDREEQGGGGTVKEHTRK